MGNGKGAPKGATSAVLTATFLRARPRVHWYFGFLLSSLLLAFNSFCPAACTPHLLAFPAEVVSGVIVQAFLWQWASSRMAHSCSVEVSTVRARVRTRLFSFRSPVSGAVCLGRYLLPRRCLRRFIGFAVPMVGVGIGFCSLKFEI